MPYRRAYKPRYKRRTTRRGTSSSGAWYNKKYSTLQIAKAAWKGVKYIKGLVNSEVYKFDNTISSTTGSDSPFVSHLTDIAQGDGDAARTGNSLYVRSVSSHLTISQNASATFTRMTVWLIQDTQQVGDTNPAYADIFETASPDTFLNTDTVGRFTILWRRSYCMSAAATEQFQINISKPLRLHVRYNGTASSDVQRNGLYLVAISDNLVATNPPSIQGQIRVSYHDN